MTALSRQLLLIGFVLAAATSAVAQNNRLTAFISDMHLGVGKTADGRWHPYEDARWAQDFALFLEELNRQGQGNTDLILNGDTFELWQSLQNDCVYSSKDFGCTEPDALNRLNIVVGAHRNELEAIRSFAVSGNNTVFIVPGNHDAALAFPRVAAEVLRAIGAPADRVKIPTKGYWISADGLLYAEHGHQIGNDVNLFTNWPTPFVEKQGVVYLQRPWGEQLVQSFYNQFEAKYPIIDNIMGDSVGIKYGMAAEGTTGLVKDIGRFLRFYFTQSSLAQLVHSLGPASKGPKWDVAAIRRGGNRFFVESIANDDPVRVAAEKSLNERSLGIEISELSDEEIQGICTLRAAMVADDAKNQRPPRLAVCPQKNLGAIATAVARSRDSIFRKYLETTITRLRAVGGFRQPFLLFIFSHTHLPEASYSPFEYSESRWRPIVVNTGAWQRTISEQQLKDYMKTRNLKEKDVLKLEPENLPPCYPVVIVPPYPSAPQSSLRYWKPSGRAWFLADRCD
jgi:hypothetical protein